jgi:glutathione S-transferase
MRARLALLASQTVCELREVKLSAKPGALIDASPKGTVPVLVLPTGKVIDESLDIMRWALERNDPQRWLDRQDSDLIAANDGPFKHHLDRYKYPHRYDLDVGEARAIHRTAAFAILETLDRRLASYPNLDGCTPGLTDAAIFPFVRQFAATDLEWFDAQPLPALHAWLAVAGGSPDFAMVMTRHAPWQPGDAPILFGQIEPNVPRDNRLRRPDR